MSKLFETLLFLNWLFPSKARETVIIDASDSEQNKKTEPHFFKTVLAAACFLATPFVWQQNKILATLLVIIGLLFVIVPFVRDIQAASLTAHASPTSSASSESSASQPKTE
ncbi:MAG: hypothetical protein II921_09930 [Treponema sp.]|nr:hypothetical protein [Treponema sp.]